MKSALEIINQEIQEEPYRRQQTFKRFGEFVARCTGIKGIYRGDIKNTQDGIHLAEHEAVDELEDAPIEQIQDIELLEGASLSTGDSAHGLIFTRANVLKEAGKKVVVECIDVAVKIFDPKNNHCLTDNPDSEYDAIIEAQKRGFEIFEPIAVVKDGEVSYLVSKYKENIISLDNVNMNKLPGEYGYQEVESAIGIITHDMAEKHAKGFGNIDPQPKNFAVSDEGESIFFDGEDMYVAKSHEEHVELLTGGKDISMSLVFEDVVCCWDALTLMKKDEHKNVYLMRATPEYYVESLIDFVDKYLDAMDVHLSAELAEVFDAPKFRETIIDYILEDYFNPKSFSPGA